VRRLAIIRVFREILDPQRENMVNESQLEFISEMCGRTRHSHPAHGKERSQEKAIRLRGLLLVQKGHR
jgi:hypothetical protein